MESLALLGYPGLFLAALLAATVIPFSSDAVLVALVVAGYDPVWLVVVATAGNWLGGLSSYGLGYLGKWEWLTRYLKVDPNKAGRMQVWALRYGPILALGSWLPLIGDLLAVGLGLAKARALPVAGWMLLGKAARYVFWAWLTLQTLEMAS